jgi:hypothetical protein
MLDAKWLELLKASGWQTAALAVASGLFILLTHRGWFPSLPDWVIPAATFGSLVCGCLALASIASAISSYVVAYHKQQEARRTFHLTPIPHQCHWGVSTQPDGTVVTQVAAHFLAKNRTDAPLHLLRARLLKPKIAGEVLQDLVIIRVERGREYGTDYAAGSNVHPRNIPPRGTLPISIMILIRGAPMKRSGMIAAILAISDDEGNEQCVTTELGCMG